MLRLIHPAHPTLWTAMAYAYVTLWFTTVWLESNVVTSLVYIFVGRIGRQTADRPPPAYPAPGTRRELFVILGERHHANAPYVLPSPSGSPHQSAACTPAWPSQTYSLVRLRIQPKIFAELQNAHAIVLPYEG